MVGSTGSRFRDPVVLCRLRNLGRVSERPLHLRALPLALLRPRNLRLFAPCLVRTEAWLVARMASVLSSATDPAVPGTLPVHVLLLSRRVLQSLLGRPAIVRGW